MATKVWKLTKIQICEFTDYEVAFETELVYPEDLLPDPPRVIAHCCSNTKDFNMADKLYCAYDTNLHHQRCWIFNMQTTEH